MWCFFSLKDGMPVEGLGGVVNSLYVIKNFDFFSLEDWKPVEGLAENDGRN